MLRRFAVFLLVFQSILFLGHFLLFKTLLAAWGPVDPSATMAMGIALAILGASFLSTSLLAFRFSSPLVRVIYTIGAVWLGIFNYLFLASIAWWLLYALFSFLNLRAANSVSAFVFFGAALAISVYGLINAAIPRIKRLLDYRPDMIAIATCRRKQAGGLFAGTLAAQADILTRAAAAGSQIVDLELESAQSMKPADLNRLRGEPSTPREKSTGGKSQTTRNP